MTCEFCGSYQFELLGQLGSKERLRCRACGMNASRTIKVRAKKRPKKVKAR